VHVLYIVNIGRPDYFESNNKDLTMIRQNRRGKFQEEDDLQNRLSNTEAKIAGSVAKLEELNRSSVKEQRKRTFH